MAKRTAQSGRAKNRSYPFTPYHKRPKRERVDECFDLHARAVPQSHGRTYVVRGLF
ncbi:MAG: hypothetical protein ACE10H_13900 [Candidatus Binatia bacterium]